MTMHVHLALHLGYNVVGAIQDVHFGLEHHIGSRIMQ
jgi:hypothetical protein